MANNDLRQESTNASIDKRTIPQGSKVIKTRLGKSSENQTGWYTQNDNYQSSQHVSCSSISCIADYIILPAGQHNTLAALP